MKCPIPIPKPSQSPHIAITVSSGLASFTPVAKGNALQ